MLCCIVMCSGNPGYHARIFYVSDLHLCNLLKNKEVESEADITATLRKIANTFLSETGFNDIILIDGDVSLDFSIFKRFVKELNIGKRHFVFTIGNHDIWSFPDDNIDQIAEKFRAFLSENGMYLLHNDILCFEDYWNVKRITGEEIQKLSAIELRNVLAKARLVLFGGTGFAGYNSRYNAECGLYRYNKTIGYSRETELVETIRFEKLYKKVCDSLFDKNVVVVTHMPLPGWSSAFAEKPEQYFDTIGPSGAYQKGFVYVSGHTHRNAHYTDGSIQIYADNQFGYNSRRPDAWPHLKSFDIGWTYDVFSEKEDGIYQITLEKYKDFYRGKNISMEFNHAANEIYLLKKNGYHCFIHRTSKGILSIMNGGIQKHLKNNDINYYFDNMDKVISAAKDPLDKYYSFQQDVSKEIIKIGGSGRIHGCIVDIDFFNHIYINPINGEVAGYWANDIIKKIIYPTIPDLLEANCPVIYRNYTCLLEEGTDEKLPILSNKKKTPLAKRPASYLETDIYKASKQINNLKKLHSTILTVWPEDIIGDFNNKQNLILEDAEKHK